MNPLPPVAALAVAICSGSAGCGGGSHGTVQPPPGDGTGTDTGTGGSDAGPDDGPHLPPPLPDAAPMNGTLRVDPVNPRYFTTGAGAIYLTGSHTWANFKDRDFTDPPGAFNYSAFLDFLVAHHHNFMRLWTWEQPHSWDIDPSIMLFITPFPWPRTGPGTASDGKPRFDLNQLDPAYFNRLRARVVAARDRGIYVSVMLFDGWDLASGYNDSTGGFPLAAGNNINGVAATPSQALALTTGVTARQEAYVRAVIDAVNDLDNVLYEIANETDTTSATLAWQKHMIDFVRSVEASKPKKHPVGMTSMYPGGSDADLYASSADWISPVDHNAGSDGRKIVLNDTDHSYGWNALKTAGPAAQRAWAWETLCRGGQPLFMDPYLEPWSGRNNPSGSQPDAYWETIRSALGYTAVYAGRLDLEHAVPLGSLCSTGFCLAYPGHQYLVYQPNSGNFTLNAVAGSYRYEWFNPATGLTPDTAGTGTIALGGGSHTFTPPFSGDAVLLLLAQ